MAQDLAERDARDASRSEAPLRPAETAHRLDTTEMSIKKGIARAIAIVEAARA